MTLNGVTDFLMLGERFHKRQCIQGDKAEKERAMKFRHIFRSAFGIALLAMVFSIALSAQSDATYIKGVVKSSSGRLFVSVWVAVSQNGVEKGRSLT